MKRLMRQPLLHFLLIGLGLFGLYALTRQPTGSDREATTVRVDQDVLLTFMQYRAKAFNRDRFEAKLAGMSAAQVERMIDDYVREEVFYREALALQLDGDDYIIRRRLVQKLEFITKGFVDAASAFGDEDVKRYFEAHKDDYYVQPWVTFTHVFFDTERHGRDQAKLLVQDKRLELRQAHVPFTQAMAHGDRFLYHVNYVERTPDYVSSHLGSDMARRIFALKPSDKTWYGPFESPYGFHLVMVSARAEGRDPALSEINERVKADGRQAFIRQQTETAIRSIIERYDIQRVYQHAPKVNRQARTEKDTKP